MGNKIIIVTLLAPFPLEMIILDPLLGMAVMIILLLPMSTIRPPSPHEYRAVDLPLLVVLITVNMMIIKEDCLPWLKETVFLPQLRHLLITEASICPLQMLLIMAILHLCQRTMIAMIAD